MAESTSRVHPGYLGFWLAWVLALALIYVWALPISWARWHLTLFVPLEAIGFIRKGHLGDTLSEVMQTFSARTLGMSRWWQSWNLIPVGLLCLISYEVLWVFGYYVDPWAHWPAGVIAAVTVFGWNLYHWVRPEKHG